MADCRFCGATIGAELVDCPKCGARLKIDPNEEYSYEPAEDPPEDTSDLSEEEWRKTIEHFLSQGQKLAAVRIYRERTGVSLFEAKKAVDEMAGIDGGDAAPLEGESKTMALSGIALGGGLLLLLILLAAVAAIVWTAG